MSNQMPEYDVMLAPGLPTLATETIHRIERELARTAALHDVCACMVCGVVGRPHAHALPPE